MKTHPHWHLTVTHTRHWLSSLPFPRCLRVCLLENPVSVACLPLSPLSLSVLLLRTAYYKISHLHLSLPSLSLDLTHNGFLLLPLFSPPPQLHPHASIGLTLVDSHIHTHIHNRIALLSLLPSKSLSDKFCLYEMRCMSHAVAVSLCVI